MVHECVVTALTNLIIIISTNGLVAQYINSNTSLKFRSSLSPGKVK